MRFGGAPWWILGGLKHCVYVVLWKCLHVFLSLMLEAIKGGLGKGEKVWWTMWTLWGPLKHCEEYWQFTWGRAQIGFHSFQNLTRKGWVWLNKNNIIGTCEKPAAGQYLNILSWMRRSIHLADKEMTDKRKRWEKVTANQAQMSIRESLREFWSFQW